MLFASVVDARVKGRCKDCHSIHNSYGGKEVIYKNYKGPAPRLTKGGCLGCHGKNPNGTQSIIIEGNTRIPQVLHNMRNDDLAGGNFYYVADAYSPDYSKGHNVMNISMMQNPPMDVPPGFIPGVIIPGGNGPEYWSGMHQLTCAGTWGCHGNRTTEDPDEAMYGAHHTNDTETDGSTVGKSYRFLYGIKGKEHKDWEYLATTENHNGYKGDSDHSTMDTISYLCGECHAKYHPNPNLGGSNEVGHAYNSVWVRHPTDIAFNSVKGGYAESEYKNYTVYSLAEPVAYIKPAGTEKEVNSESIIMCLSCHRAHASPFPDILRWDYSQLNAKSISGKGCLTCHTGKGQ